MGFPGRNHHPRDHQEHRERQFLNMESQMQKVPSHLFQESPSLQKSPAGQESAQSGRTRITEMFLV